jgi:radical SAM superfamily enzyme YgiQ (UPF0313 family)
MKVAFLTGKVNVDKKIGPHQFYTGERRPPHGIGYMTAILRKHNIQVDIFDRYCGETASLDYDFADYDLLGIYCTSICMDDIRATILHANANKIAVGGPHWSCFPNDGLDTNWRNKIDYIVRGEGERVIENILYSSNPPWTVDMLPQRLSDDDLDNLPRFPWRYFWENYRDMYFWNSPFTSDLVPIFTMNTSRGCPFNCTFCSTKKIWGKQITMMSADRIMDDIEYLVQALGAKGIYFREDNFTVRKSRVQELCQKILESGIKIKWACETRVDTVDRETLTMMRDAGCIGFYVGVEHGSQKILDILQKGVTVDQIIWFFDTIHELGMKAAASMIISHPDETQEDKDAFWKLINRIKPDLHWQNHYRKEG